MISVVSLEKIGKFVFSKIENQGEEFEEDEIDHLLNYYFQVAKEITNSKTKNGAEVLGHNDLKIMVGKICSKKCLSTSWTRKRIVENMLLM